MKLGLGSGLDKKGTVILKPFDKLISSFGSRVFSDGGIAESLNCIKSNLTAEQVEAANFVLTPNGYKSGKLYALKPESGELDVTWSRAGEATRVDKNGLIVNEPANVPRLDYLLGSCPTLLVEEQKTNYIYPSDFSNINSSGSSIIEEQVNDSDFYSGVAKRIVTSNRSKVGLNVNLESGETYVTSCFYKLISGNFLIRFSGNIADNAGDVVISSNGNLLSNVTSITINDIEIVDYPNGMKRIKISFVAQKTSNGLNGVYFGVENGEAILNDAQLDSEIASSYIPTDNSIVTRNADIITLTPPLGTTEIKEHYADGSINTITTIPSTYQIPNGRFKYILFN